MNLFAVLSCAGATCREAITIERVVVLKKHGMLTNFSEHVSCPNGLMFSALEGGRSGGRSLLLIYINFGVDVLTKSSALKHRMPKTYILKPYFVSRPKGLMLCVLEGGGSGGRSILFSYINGGVDVPTEPSVLKNMMQKTCCLRPNCVSCMYIYIYI